MRYKVDDFVYKDGTILMPHRLDFELDGERIYIVQAADDEEGWIEAPLINVNDGRPYFDHEKDDYVIVRKCGKVRILVDDPFYNRIDEEYLRSMNNTPLWTLAARSGNYPFAIDAPPFRPTFVSKP